MQDVKVFLYFRIFKWQKMVKWIKVVGKVFLMIKNGPGFMVSQMHSLFNKVVDNGTLELTYEIATQKFNDKL